MATISMLMLGVSDVARSAAFYRDIVGLAPQGESAEFAFFDAGPVRLALSRPLGKAVQPLAGATEVILPADSVAVSHADLIARGCTSFINEPREVMPGAWAVSFADPDGHRLTLFGPQ